MNIEWWSARQAAACAGVSRPSIYAYVKTRGFPPPVKMGGRALWVRAEVEAWRDAQIAKRARPNG